MLVLKWSRMNIFLSLLRFDFDIFSWVPNRSAYDWCFVVEIFRRKKVIDVNLSDYFLWSDFGVMLQRKIDGEKFCVLRLSILWAGFLFSSSIGLAFTILSVGRSESSSKLHNLVLLFRCL